MAMEPTYILIPFVEDKAVAQASMVAPVVITSSNNNTFLSLNISWSVKT